MLYLVRGIKYRIAGHGISCPQRGRQEGLLPQPSRVIVYRHQGWTFTKRAMDQAARGGHLEMVKWLHGEGAECSTDAMDLAAQEGHLEVVQVYI